MSGFMCFKCGGRTPKHPDSRNLCIECYSPLPELSSEEKFLEACADIRDGSWGHWQHLAREDLRQAGIPMWPGDQWEPGFVEDEYFKEEASDDDSMETFIESLSSSGQESAFLHALSSGHSQIEAARISGLTRGQARHFLDRLARTL